jgi:hypothetical protein
MSCDKRKTMKLATAIVLSSAFCVACCGSRKAMQTKDNTPASPADTIEQFTPLHPPVVVPHDWRDELKDTKQPSATEENN